MQRKMRNPPGGRGKNPFESAREDGPAVVTEFNDYGHQDPAGPGAESSAPDLAGVAGRKVARTGRTV